MMRINTLFISIAIENGNLQAKRKMYKIKETIAPLFKMQFKNVSKDTEIVSYEQFKKMLQDQEYCTM